MGAIQLNKVEKWFGELQVIKGIDLDIQEGEFVIFVGPSGCGKSTLLRLISGLEETSRGTIEIDSKDVTALPPSGRGLSMVFQSYALYPHMSVRENVGFGLKTAGIPKAEIDSKVNAAAEVLKLDDYLDRRPKALSGGQRQRVAIGRAIVREPSAFLFDEPLSNLDAALRVEMRFEIARLHKSLGTTMIYVTHDQVEAMTLADKIVVLQAGRIEQVGSPRELYERPDNLFVAQFIGSPKMNVLPCSVEGDQFSLQGHGGGHYPHAGLPQRPVRLGVRPEHMSIVGDGEGHCSGTVEVAEYLGADTFLYVALDGLETILVRISGADTIEEGARIGLVFDETRMHFFDAEDRAIR
ncbi:MAG: ABC transporter ATP-binding protein [Roseibium album]|nr:ABC transporter ATP-binding protein [Roseibium album]MBG6142263.1 multiple sugar transport system ATP-binding protein [Labrenzia sp. EL_142]MBG6160142.1 multiple sugar transport system ATP-binding protein [Labrenzia sp. EL_162]MBG6166179.1 multiple sugar transport system ATP-binding protein [Labrenzia sp. EL_195]MBG6198674.1 multiple sugar transport system ATP-binding protein [Labrenzia sp. EL_159]MBG6205058.1 multiple sugar transport system ATP-binding protein [Labrenzia sp. EL_13]MCR9058